MSSDGGEAPRRSKRGRAITIIAIVALCYLVVSCEVLMAWRHPRMSTTTLQPSCGPNTPGAVAEPGEPVVYVSVHPIVGTYGFHQPVYGTNAICVLRASDGAQVAQVTLRGAQAGTLYVRTITPAGDLLLLGNTGEVCAMRLADGTLAWCKALENLAVPLVDDGVIYLEAQTGVYAVRPEDGQVFWQSERIPAMGRAQMLAAGGMLYVPLRETASTQTSEVCALREADGARQWCMPLVSTTAGNAQVVNLALAGERLFAVAGGDPGTPLTLFMLNPTTGAALSQRTLGCGSSGGSVWGAGDTLYTVTFDCPEAVSTPQVYIEATRASTGARVWRREFPNAMYTVSLGPDALHVVLGGTLNALAAATGKTLWQVVLENAPQQPMLETPENFYAVVNPGGIQAYSQRGGGQMRWASGGCARPAAQVTPSATRSEPVMWCHWLTSGLSIGASDQVGMPSGLFWAVAAKMACCRLSGGEHTVFRQIDAK
jgi:outer membrane protein assembly factor BamB